VILPAWLDDVRYMGQDDGERLKMKYYHFVRSEIEPLLPKDAARILHVGAAPESLYDEIGVCKVCRAQPKSRFCVPHGSVSPSS
jgi:hypothetical protein